MLSAKELTGAPGQATSWKPTEKDPEFSAATGRTAKKATHAQCKRTDRRPTDQLCTQKQKAKEENL